MSSKGYKLTQEQKDARRFFALKMGHGKWMKGRKFSEEHKKNISMGLLMHYHNVKKKIVKVNCLICKKEFFSKESRFKIGRGKFCSRECSSGGSIGRPAWNKGISGYHIHSEEWKRKKSESMSGSNHWAWRVDRSLVKRKDERADAPYHCWMRDCRKRDMGCRINNQDCKGRLEVHHILSWKDYPEFRYDINNGITLCHFHHPKTREEEERLIPYFRNMVEVKESICQ